MWSDYQFRELARQHRETRMKEADSYRRIQKAGSGQPGILVRLLYRAGEVAIAFGQWLQEKTQPCAASSIYLQANLVPASQRDCRNQA